MFSHNSVFDYLEEESVDRFVFKFYQVVHEYDERNLSGPNKFFYNGLKRNLREYAEEGDIKKNDLVEMENSVTGSMNIFDEGAEYWFNEAVMETYDELGIDHAI